MNKHHTLRGVGVWQTPTFISSLCMFNCQYCWCRCTELDVKLRLFHNFASFNAAKSTQNTTNQLQNILVCIAPQILDWRQWHTVSAGVPQCDVKVAHVASCNIAWRNVNLTRLKRGILVCNGYGLPRFNTWYIAGKRLLPLWCALKAAVAWNMWVIQCTIRFKFHSCVMWVWYHASVCTAHVSQIKHQF